MLEARGLALSRGTRQLFSEVSFTLNAGASLRILGENGSGKTSLLRVLCGLARPDHGAVLWGGHSIGPGAASYGRALVYLAHTDAIKLDLLAWENLAYGPLLGQPGARAQALAALDAADMAALAFLPARVLSQGQRKRLALARLYCAPAGSLWILDEPFSSLDGAACTRLAALLSQHCASGGMLVYTTHQEQALAHAASLDLSAAVEAAC